MKPVQKREHARSHPKAFFFFFFITVVALFGCAALSVGALWCRPQPDERLRALRARKRHSTAALRRPLAFLNESAGRSSLGSGLAFDAREWPAFLINQPADVAKRKWAENEMARIGYHTYIDKPYSYELR